MCLCGLVVHGGHSSANGTVLLHPEMAPRLWRCTQFAACNSVIFSTFTAAHHQQSEHISCSAMSKEAYFKKRWLRSAWDCFSVFKTYAPVLPPRRQLRSMSIHPHHQHGSVHKYHSIRKRRFQGRENILMLNYCTLAYIPSERRFWRRCNTSPKLIRLILHPI